MNTTIEIGESVEEDDEGNEVVVEAVPAKVNIPIEKKIEVDETWMVNSANVRRFLRRMGGNRRETWESTLQTSVKWRKPAGDGTPFLVIQAIGNKRS